MKKVKKVSKILFSAYLISAFIFSSGAIMPVRTAEASSSGEITICHRTGSHENPYEQKSVNKNATVDGHDSHDGPIWYPGITEAWGDIIPPFTYGHASSTQQYPGKNWTNEGQAIWNNDCQVGFPPQETSVTLCKEDKDGKKLSGWELSLVSKDNTFSGTTEEVCSNTGCITFLEVPYGTYEIEEELKDGWENVSGLGEVEIDSENPTFTVVNKEKEEVGMVTIVAYKVVCEKEYYLPNWAKTSGYPSMITETLITEYIESSSGKCWFEPSWEFEWGETDAEKLDGDYVGRAPESKGWNTFGPTDSEGKATVEIEHDKEREYFWMREVLKQGYIPFSDSEDGNISVSAELLCHVDGYKYDNYDRVDNPQAGGTYFCVAFNAPEEVATTSVTLCKEDEDKNRLPGWVLSLVSDDHTFSGETEPVCSNTGCITFLEVPYGTYEIEEELKDGWENVSGLGEVEIDSENPTFTVVNKIKETASLYTVIFDGNNGEPETQTKEVEEGETVDSLPTVTRSGYNFVEWNTDSEGQGDVFTTETIVTANITVYAIWEEKTVTYYTVTFMDGDGIYATTSVAEGESVGDDMPADPEKEGYEFKGWEDGDKNPFTSETEVTDDITVYAIWQKKVEPDDPVDPSAPRGRPGQLLAPPRPEEVLGEEIVVEEPCTIYLYEYIRYGANNNPAEVIKLQKFLNEHMGINLSVTGVYDWATMQAVNEFQVQYKEQVLRPWVDAGAYCDINRPTGHVYKTTQRWINLIVCPELNLPMPDLSGYPKADCAAYWRAVLGEDIVLDEDYVPEDVVEEPMPEEEEEEMPEEEMPFEIDDIIREEEPEEEPEIPTSWIIALIILAAAAGIWAVYKGIKK